MQPNIKNDLGIVIALQREIAPFLNKCSLMKQETISGFRFTRAVYQDRNIVVVICGPGRERAEKATRILIEDFCPQHLISAGYAGSLQEEVGVGDTVLVEAVVGVQHDTIRLNRLVETNEKREERSVSYADNQRENKTTGTLLTVDEILSNHDDRKRAAVNYGAGIVDMETLSVAQVAQDQQIPLFGLRVISDDCQTCIPQEISAIMKASGVQQLITICTAVCMRPRLLSELWKLKLNSDKASRNLSVELERLIPMLPR